MTDLATLSKENSASRTELINFVNSLTLQQLNQEMPAGWTTLAVFAHLAFWDQRAITLLKKWQKEGISASLNDTDVINEVTRPFFRVLDPEAGKKLVLTTASEVDDLIASLPVAFFNDVMENGKTVHLNRAEHRRMHIEEIKQALGR
jgi:hypothetical protein